MFKWNDPKPGHLDNFMFWKAAAEWSFKIAGWITLLGALKFAHMKSGATFFEMAYIGLSILPAFMVSSIFDRVTFEPRRQITKWVTVPVTVLFGVGTLFGLLAVTNYAASAIATFQASMVK
jgi:hypothetical protein